MIGKHIELFLIDGTAGGLTTAEIVGWSGHVMRGERSQLNDFLRRDEAERNGAYMLLGDDETAPGGTQVYIGRTERIGDRLKQHRVKKDFWDRFVVITTKDDAFTEGHWGYLEARLVSMAKEADRARLTNDNAPQGRKLSEAQSSDMEAFIQQLNIVLPVLNINVIRSRKTGTAAHSEPAPAQSPIFFLRETRRGVDARAQLVDGEFTILEGSIVTASWDGVGKAVSTQRAYSNYRAQHAQLLAEDAIVLEGPHARVMRDIRFGSPSTAGAVALGRSCNGRREWIDAGGTTYGHWEDGDRP